MNLSNTKQRAVSRSFSERMKTITILVICLIFVFSEAKGQSNKVSIALNDTSLESVIEALRKQTIINIIYNNEEVNKYKSVSANVTNGTVEDVLKQSLSKTNLTFTKENNTIIIATKKTSSIPPVPYTGKTQTVRGTVIDRDSKMTLPGAAVVLVGSNPIIGTATDFDGNFVLNNVPVGRQDFKVTFIGYEEAIAAEVLVGSVKEVILNFELTESLLKLSEISLSNTKGEAINDMATISAKSFSVEETKRYAASIGDPARMVQSFAGVSTGDDASNEIIIRGNSPNWLLWRLEGVEIPSPNHFSEEGGSAALSVF